jgi:hypothetical protein
MPSQFRSGSSPQSETPPVSKLSDVLPVESSKSNANFWLDSIRSAFSNQASQASESADAPPEPVEEAGFGSGLHHIIKSVDVWFNYQLSLLEKFAVAEGIRWAEAGIPRQDAPAIHELPIETTLKARAFEIYQEWIARVKRKVQDSIQAASSESGDKLVQLRHASAQFERTTVDITTTEDTVRDREEALRNQQRTFGSPALLGHKKYLAWMVLLGVVDWVANVPIFNELLPSEFGRREIWRQLAAAAQKNGGAFGGVRMLLDRMVFHLDVSIFALGVITFLIVMAHFCGEGLRNWRVFDPKGEPLLASSLESQRSQAVIPIVLGLIAVLLTISFLYFSRSQLVSATTTGIAQAKQEFEAAGKAVAEAKSEHGNLSKLPQLQQTLDEATTKLDDWRERDRFARDIEMMNIPIFLLNVVLSLTAITAAYCAAAPKLIEGKLEDPLIPELKAKLASLRMESVGQRQSLKALDTDIQNAISQAKYLARTRPLEDWEAKVQRLNAVVTLFRAENARARGADPESIIAFKQPSKMDLPKIPDEPFTVPVEIAAYEDEFRRSRKEFSWQKDGGPSTLSAGATA